MCAGLRAFLYYCMDNGYISKFQIKLIKAVKQVKPIYTENELEKLLEKPDVKKCSFIDYRNWVISNYLLATGNRLRTIINMKIEDVNFDNCQILLKATKNRKQYIIPLSEELQKILQEYLVYRKGKSPDDYLFCNSYGKKMNKRTLQGQIKKYNNDRGVFKTSAHLYRHTFAVNYLLNGGDIMRLQKLLGHSSLDMVKEYLDMISECLDVGFKNFNPLDNFMKKNSKSHIKMQIF